MGTNTLDAGALLGAVGGFERQRRRVLCFTFIKRIVDT